MFEEHGLIQFIYFWKPLAQKECGWIEFGLPMLFLLLSKTSLLNTGTSATCRQITQIPSCYGFKDDCPRMVEGLMIVWVLLSFHVRGKVLSDMFWPSHDTPVSWSLLCTKVHKMKIKCLSPAWQKPFLCRVVAAVQVNKWMDSNHSLVDETVQLKHRHLHGVISLNCQWAPLDTTSVQIDFSIDFGWSW